MAGFFFQLILRRGNMFESNTIALVDSNIILQSYFFANTIANVAQ